MARHKPIRVTDALLRNIAAGIENSGRLKGLSDAELVRECLGTPAADFDVVVEMMDRLHPGWENEPTGRLNTYTCPAGHVTVTRDADEGTTPMTIVCNQGGHDCPNPAFSAFYRVEGRPCPTHEWYKPTVKRAAKIDRTLPGTLDHVKLGGLLLRPIAPPPLA